MRHSRIPSMPAATAILGLFFGLIFAPAAQGQTQGSWTVKLRAMQNPLPLGQCTAIEVTVTDATGGAPVRPDRRQVDWQDFDLSLTAPTADAFAWSDPTHPRFLCARAPTATSVLVVAYYPARHLTAAEVVPGISAQQTIEVALQGAGQFASAAAAPGQPYVSAQTPPGAPQGQGYANQATGAAAGAAAGAGQAGGGAAGAAPQGQNYGQQPNQAGGGAAGGAAGAGQAGGGAAGAAPQGQNYGQQPNQAGGAAAGAAGQPGGGAAGAAPQAQNYAASPNQAGATAAGAAQAPNPAGASAAAGQYAAQPNQQASPTPGGVTPTTVAATAGAPPQLTTQPAEKKGGGGFFKKLGQHLKDKASEVTSQTAANLTNSATQVVDATAQTGSNLVSGAAAEVTSVAQAKVGSVGTALMPSAFKGGANADNLRVAVASGYAELRMMRFITNTEVLDVTGRDLVRNLAQVLKEIPGNYVIQAHVDQLPSPAEPGASQMLSQHRAAAVKNALIAAGVDASRLTSLGYGTSDPKPEVPVEGGLPSSARIVIAKLQQ